VDGKRLTCAPSLRAAKMVPRNVRSMRGKGKTKEIAAAAGSQYVGYIEGDQTVSVRK